jgi:cytochrome c oxidase subunit IV
MGALKLGITAFSESLDVGEDVLGDYPVREFKIEADALSRRRETRIRLLLWGTVLLLTAATILIFVLGVSGALNAKSILILLFVFTVLGSVIGVSILACREALNYAKRQMVFVLDGSKIVRKRQGYPEVKIAFSEIETLSEELGWLIIKSTEPRRKITVPNNVRGYEVIRTEIAKHHALSPSAKFPLMSATKSTALMIISVLSWATVLWFPDMRVVIPAGAIALVTLAVGSYRLWTLLHRDSKRPILWICLGFVWFSAILIIYLRLVRP